MPSTRMPEPDSGEFALNGPTRRRRLCLRAARQTVSLVAGVPAPGSAVSFVRIDEERRAAAAYSLDDPSPGTGTLANSRVRVAAVKIGVSQLHSLDLLAELAPSSSAWPAGVRLVGAHDVQHLERCDAPGHWEGVRKSSSRDSRIGRGSDRFRLEEVGQHRPTAWYPPKDSEVFTIAWAISPL